jgi:hypothetical protein
VTLSDKTLMAYADGQLSPAEHARVERLLAQSPELSARLEVFETTGHKLAILFDDHMHSPLPDKLRKACGKAPSASRWLGLAQLAEKLENFVPATPEFGLAAAAAALFIVGTGTGWLMRGGSEASDGIVLVHNNRIVAGNTLRRALDGLLGAKEYAAVFQGKAAEIAIKLSFKNRAHDYCRQYEIGLADSVNYAGLACKSNGEWNIVLHTLANAERPQGHKIGPAGNTSTALEAAIMATIDGDAIGPQEEEKLIADGWKAY